MIQRRETGVYAAVVATVVALASSQGRIINSSHVVSALIVGPTPLRRSNIRSQVTASPRAFRCPEKSVLVGTYGLDADQPAADCRGDPTALRMSPTDTESADQNKPKKKATEVAQAEFWKAQSALAESMTDTVDKTVRSENKAKFAKRRLALVNETLLFSTLIFAFLWLTVSNPFSPISYAFGAALGTAYSYGLGKFVETIGGSADDVEDLKGAGVGQARFAFLILLFIIVGKFRAFGLQEIPSIAGFFTYQIATLSQGLREYDD